MALLFHGFVRFALSSPCRSAACSAKLISCHEGAVRASSVLCKRSHTIGDCVSLSAPKSPPLSRTTGDGTADPRNPCPSSSPLPRTDQRRNGKRTAGARMANNCWPGDGRGAPTHDARSGQGPPPSPQTLVWNVPPRRHAATWHRTLAGACAQRREGCSGSLGQKPGREGGSGFKLGVGPATPGRYGSRPSLVRSDRSCRHTVRRSPLRRCPHARPGSLLRAGVPATVG